MNQSLRLNDLLPGQHALVKRLTATGSMRRRLLDIGLIENTAVTCLGKSPCGDPHAYLIRGAVIAIRNEDCKDILIQADGNKSTDDPVIALAGNPNVGKSTVFNALTGMKQHTGNWPGKTVSNARGLCRSDRHSYVLVDVPGTYSLMAHSAEEEAARNFICFGHPDAVIVVCDATCLERNLNLVLQTLEISSRVIVCVNLMDEAKRKNISLDLPLLSGRLGVPVIGTTARKKKSLTELLDVLDDTIDSPKPQTIFSVRYPEAVETAATIVQTALESLIPPPALSKLPNTRWLSLKLLEGDSSLCEELRSCMDGQLLQSPVFLDALSTARASLEKQNIDQNRLKDLIVSSLVNAAEGLCQEVVHSPASGYHRMDQKIDRVLTSRLTGYPIMLALLALIFWVTISGANYPSELLSGLLFRLQDRLTLIFQYFHAPEWLHGLLVLGVYRVLAWVVSVMLPPMAVFFPLFTLLEDSGYLPRIAYNLDRPFQCCCACGKQALTMCMGFGCNAVGVTGCRIIDSPRERLLAILTNSFVPCNGRFPTLIAILTMFFIGSSGSPLSGLLSALMLTGIIVLGIAFTLLATKLLSKTVLKGVPSSFTLELPPYRKPQVGKVVIRSIFDRTLFVLGRAAAVAAPAGLLIWLMANINLSGMSILNHFAAFLNPFARLMGLDGVILIAFILGFPANEIVIPIILMAYMSQGTLMEPGSLTAMKTLFTAHGWTWVTAVNVMLFSLLHWPCSTTLLTIKKETGSLKWTALAAALPTAAGIVCCIAFTGIVKLLA